MRRLPAVFIRWQQFARCMTISGCGTECHYGLEVRLLGPQRRWRAGAEIWLEAPVAGRLRLEVC
jgi:hypothetical protein